MTQRSTTDNTNFTEIGSTTTLTDKHGRVARIEDTPAGGATKRVEFTYDGTDKLIDMARTVPGGFFFDTRYEYDNAGRVTEIAHLRDSATNPFTTYLYEYDEADRITELTTHYATGITQVDGTRTEEFDFDLAGQLTANDSSVTGGDESFAYDDNGNRMGKGITTGAFNRLTSDANYTYDYDKEGNRTRKTAKVGGAYTVYTWDHRNRLTKVEDFTSGGQITDYSEYRYDAEDRNVERAFGEYSQGHLEYELSNWDIYNGDKLALSFIGNNVGGRRYTWAPEINQLITDEYFNVYGGASELLWVATDHLGSVNDILDSYETLVEHREYDTFGMIDEVFQWIGGEYQSIERAGISSRVAHAGSLWEESAQHYIKGNRPYDPHTGQFLTTDFGGFIDGPNLYRYGGNDPINNFDPTGNTQAGNPLNNLFGGGYSGGKVAPRRSR